MQRNKKCTHFLQNCNKDWKVFCLLWSNVVLLFNLCEDLSTFVEPKVVSQICVHVQLAQNSHIERQTDRGGETENETENSLMVQIQKFERINVKGKKRRDEKGCMRKSCMHPRTRKKNRKRKKKNSGSVHIKKHKQILCSFITKYSATINIAFLSPFHLRLRMLTPRLFSVLNTCKYEA